MNKLPYPNFASDMFQDLAIFSLSAKIYVDYCISVLAHVSHASLGLKSPFIMGQTGCIHVFIIPLSMLLAEIGSLKWTQFVDDIYHCNHHVILVQLGA